MMVGIIYDTYIMPDLNTKSNRHKAILKCFNKFVKKLCKRDGCEERPILEILKLFLSFPPYNNANERERGA